MLSRRGASLAELLVALTLGAIVMGAATGSVLRQQRTAAALATLGRTASQLRAATAVVPAQLALLSHSAADLVAGEVSDSALQLRAAVAIGTACDGAAPLTLSVDADDPSGGGVASSVRAGDSLWWYRADSARWTGTRVTDAWTDSLPCAAMPGGAAARAVLRVRGAIDGGAPPRAPVRVTRTVRFAVYRSGDGSWQLGYREWSDAAGGLSPPQPVAGPFERVAADGARTGFRYFDADGGELDPAGDPGARTRIARVRFTALAPAPPPGVAALTRRPPRDSADVALAPP